MSAKMSWHLLLYLASLLIPALSKVIWTDGNEDGNATLVCPHGQKTQWITPGQLVIHPDLNYDEIKYKFDVDNSSLLTVTSLNATDAGVYICGIPTSKDDNQHDTSVQIELHVKLPYADTDYTDNAVTGVVVACVVALIFGGSCLLYKYRYKEKSFTDMEIAVGDSIYKSDKMKDAEALPQKTEITPIYPDMGNRSLGEGCENPALVESDSDSDDEKPKKHEDVPLEVTSEQTPVTAHESQETTGM